MMTLPYRWLPITPDHGLVSYPVTRGRARRGRPLGRRAPPRAPHAEHGVVARREGGVEEREELRRVAALLQEEQPVEEEQRLPQRREQQPQYIVDHHAPLASQGCGKGSRKGYG